MERQRSTPILDQRTARLVLWRLRRQHASARIELHYANPVELLVATILSAQCTDRRVNQITAGLFRKYRRPEDYLAVPPQELETDIRSLGFFRQKARSIRAALALIIREHGGHIPASMEALTRLPGVGRKTANVILGNAFGIPGIAVDTHVIRLSGRIGLSNQSDPIKIERDLMALFPAKDWIRLSHVLIFHGRYICRARRPACAQCPITRWCRYYRRLFAHPANGMRK